MQSGHYELDNAFPLPWGGQDGPGDTYEDTPPPTITVSDEYDFTLGGNNKGVRTAVDSFSSKLNKSQRQS